MNYRKKHKRHVDYVETYYCVGEEDIHYTMLCVFYNRQKKHRKSLRLFHKDVRSGAWQKRVYEQTGIKL